MWRKMHRLAPAALKDAAGKNSANKKTRQKENPP
jgi:hypothetical protein